MKAIGMVEYKTVSSGIKAADLIVKTAEVELLEAQTEYAPVSSLSSLPVI